MSKRKGRSPPAGYDYIAPILTALENELRDKVRESNAGKRNTESMWPVLQIQNQRTRYIYDMHYVHHKIDRKLYNWCLKNKLADANLIAKWKKPGYERLCSTYVINPSNYKFGTVSICRVPHTKRRDDLKFAQDPTTGCLGCASGKGAGPKNIFGNKYGQRLAAIQVARERKREEQEMKKRLKHEQMMEERRKAFLEQQQREEEERNNGDGNGDSATDESSDDNDDDDDYGPTPAAGVWAGSEKLEKQSEALTFGEEDLGDDEDGDEETDDEEENDNVEQNISNKKMKHVE